MPVKNRVLNAGRRAVAITPWPTRTICKVSAIAVAVELGVFIVMCNLLPSILVFAISMFYGAVGTAVLLWLFEPWFIVKVVSILTQKTATAWPFSWAVVPFVFFYANIAVWGVIFGLMFYAFVMAFNMFIMAIGILIDGVGIVLGLLLDFWWVVVLLIAMCILSSFL